MLAFEKIVDNLTGTPKFVYYPLVVPRRNEIYVISLTKKINIDFYPSDTIENLKAKI